jgi:predicted ferric reductase
LKNALTGVGWVILYVFFAVCPLIIVLLGHPPAERPFLVELSVALGFVGLAMMGLQFALIARFKTVSAPFGIDALTRFHKEVSYVALVFILAHPILLFVQNSGKYLPLLNVFTAPWRARFAVASVVLLLGLVGLSVARGRLRLSYEAWQLSHGVLAVAVVVLALAHIQGVGYYVSGDVKRALFYVFAGGLVFLLGWIRVVSPVRRLRRPWRIAEIVPERGDSATMVIEPVGHGGFSFEPGQFGWIVVDRSPFSRSDHPFSFSSEGDRTDGGRISLTIRALGDFTRGVASFRVGTRVYLDGPHGVFTMDRQQAQGYVFIGGGVGITPLFSMLLTMRAREDIRPVTLFYANRRWEDVTFREQLSELEASMPQLRVVHVLEDPPPGWEGEVGRIDADKIARYVPQRQAHRLEYFVCGPDAMMDAMEDLLLSMGVPASRLNTERFNFV